MTNFTQELGKSFIAARGIQGVGSYFSRNRIGSVAIGIASLVSMMPTNVEATESRFDSDAQGWTIVDWDSATLSSIVGSYPAAWNVSGGNPGGYISATDPSGQWFWFSAPSAFLGDRSSVFGGRLVFDLSVDISDGDTTVVMLTGAGKRLYFDGRSPLPSFTSYSVPLTPAGWRLNDWQTGVTPTSAELQSVLGNLDGVYISGDWHNGIESAGLDNVQLVPEPNISALFLLGGVALTCLAKQRKLTKQVARC